MASSSASRPASLPLKDYLKKYETSSTNEEQNSKKTRKKKKKKKPSSTDPGAIRVVDEDPIWQKQIKEEDEDDDVSAEEEQPQINEDIEVKRLKRLEELRLKRPYHTVSEDGSGWIPISSNPKTTNSGENTPDLSPPGSFDSLVPESKNSGERGLSDLSPPRRVHGNSVEPGGMDLSPPRRGRCDRESNAADLSPPRRVRHNSDGHGSVDLSPPRRIRHDSEERDNADLSPPRRVRRDEPNIADLSPPRRVRRNSDGPDFADLSPPRRDRRNSDGPDIADLSPPRRVRRKSKELGNSSDLCSPPAGIPGDLSPPRKSKISLSFSRTEKEEKRAGLFNKQEIKEENDIRREKDRARFSKMDPSISGRGAEPVYRKEGKRVSKDEYLKLQQGEEKPKEKKLEWGKGLAQKREAEAREHELELEKNKPFARSRDDPELDKMFRERIRWGDPMAHLVKRKHSEPVLEDLGGDEKMKESGFIIPQTIPSHSWLKRGVDPPGNRYGIRPGRHWDGVDRSNGFEKEMFKRQNEKRATEQEAYLWSVSDM